MSEIENDDERRASERRWVMMRVLIEDTNQVYLSQTINVSDTGILIERMPAPQLMVGQTLSVVIEGLVDDSGAAGSRELIVVRIDESRIALRFAD